VASEIDDSTERIIRYLSEAGIGINAVRFGFYQAKDGREFLSRTFTVALEEAEKTIAKESGQTPLRVKWNGGQMMQAWAISIVTAFVCLPHVSRTTGRTRPPSGFLEASEDGSSRKIIFSLVPGKSSKETGLRYQVYRNRLADYVHTSVDEILKHLPSNPEGIRLF